MDLYKSIKNNQQFCLTEDNNNIPSNNINTDMFTNYNNNINLNDIINYNRMIANIQKNNSLYINNDDNNNLLSDLIKNNSNNYINLMNYINNNSINRKIKYDLNENNELNNINKINIYKVYNINNINEINNINIFTYFNNIININKNQINTSNLNHNFNYYNYLNQINNSNIINTQINNNINNINNINNMNISQNSQNENNLNENYYKTNDIYNNNFQNLTKNINNKNIFKLLNTDNNSMHNNDLNKDIKDFIKFLNNLANPLVISLCKPKSISEIQKKLLNSNNICKVLLIKLLSQKGLSIIMKNTYGNYFFQQLIKGAEKNIISIIISYISNDFIDISKDPSGTFSIQALLNEISSVKEVKEILNYIEDHELEMAFNKNATYVLQKIVLLFPDIHRINLNKIILNNFKELCIDGNGICLIKNFIKTNTLINNKIRIMEEISKNFVILAQNPFGNYGIQLLMEVWEENELGIIKKKIMDNIFKLSLQQFSSNVVEKAIEIFDDKTKEKLIKKLCFENHIIILLKNKFGKFVLDKAINHMKMNLKNEFEIYLINNIINNNVFNHKEKNKIKRLVMKLKNNNLQNDYIFEFNKEICVKGNDLGNIYNNNYIKEYNHNLDNDK